MDRNRRINSRSNGVFGIMNSIDDSRTIKEAVNRAGHNKNIKGHILEVKFKNRYNRNPLNVLKGNKAQLTKSSTAVRDDVIVMNQNKVVKRFQLKDTPSKSGIRDTAERIKRGQYRGTNIVGTSETASKIKGVSDSGISTKTTELLACEANGANPLKKLNLLSHHGKKLGASGGIISGGFSLLENGIKYIKGEKDLDECVTSTGIEATKGAISTCAGGVVDSAVTMSLAATPAAPVSKAIGMSAGAYCNMKTYKMLNSLEKKANSFLDQRVERDMRANLRAYDILKKDKII